MLIFLTKHYIFHLIHRHTHGSTHTFNYYVLFHYEYIKYINFIIDKHSNHFNFSLYKQCCKEHPCACHLVYKGARGSLNYTPNGIICQRICADLTLLDTLCIQIRIQVLRSIYTYRRKKLVSYKGFSHGSDGKGICL